MVCAHESMTLMAVGFKDGTVVTVKGNLTRDRLSTMKVVHSESTPGVYVTGEGCVLFSSISVHTEDSLASTSSAMHLHVHECSCSEHKSMLGALTQKYCRFSMSLHYPMYSCTGLGFRQVKNRTILMISTSDAVYAVDLGVKTEVYTVHTPFTLSHNIVVC